MKMVNCLRTVLAAFLLILFSQNSSAQKFNVKWGDNTKLKYDFDDAVPLADGKFIILKLKVKQKVSVFGLGAGSGPDYEPSLVLVAPDMSQITEKELPIAEKNASLKGFEKYGNNIFFMYTAYDKENKTTSFYALKLDEKTLAPTAKMTLGSFESDNRGDQATPTYKLSSDSSKVLLLVEGPWRKKESEKYYIGVFNTDLKKLWSRQVELPIEQRYMDIYDSDVTDDGKVFIAIKHYEKEVSRESVREDGSKVPSYVYKMLVYADGAKDKELKFDLNNHFIQGTKLIYNKNGTITVAGLYKRKHNGNINGAFYANFDASTSEVKNPKMVEFPSEMITLVDKDNYGSDKEKDPGLYPNFRIRHIMSRSNGSVDLISEYYKLVIVTTTRSSGTGVSFGGTTTTYHYYYGDIINTNIDKNGKATFTRIPKNQKMVNSTIFLGYFPIVFNDKLVILYNDDEDNIDRDLEKAPDDVRSFKQAVFAAATIDAKGNLTRQAIYSHRDEDYVSVPVATTKISDTKFLIVSDLLKLFKKRTRFGVLEMK